MAYTVFPNMADNQECSKLAYPTLDEMIHQGNKIAEVRKAELTHLERLCQELAARPEQSGFQIMTLPSPEGSSTDRDDGSLISENTQTEMTVPPTMGAETGPFLQNHIAPISDYGPQISHTEFLDDIGISSEDFLAIVDQMGDQDIFPNSLMDHQLNLSSTIF